MVDMSTESTLTIIGAVNFVFLTLLVIIRFKDGRAGRRLNDINNSQNKAIDAGHLLQMKIKESLSELEHKIDLLKKSMDKALAELEKDMKSVGETSVTLAKGQEMHGATLANIEEKIVATVDSMVKSSDENTAYFEALKTGYSAGSKEMLPKHGVIEKDDTSSVVAGIVSREPMVNFTGYNNFRRLLSKQDRWALYSKWFKKLDLEQQESFCSYMAHRACAIELQFNGRLATGIMDIVIRSACAVSLAARRPNMKVLEIGTLFGTGLGIIGDLARQFNPNVSLTALDPLSGYYGDGTVDIVTGVPVTKENFWKNIEKLDLVDNTRLIEKFSTDPEALEILGDEKFDLVIIDGDHLYDGVKNDFEKFSPLLADGGMIIMDDYGTKTWPDVKMYTDEMLEERQDTWQLLDYQSRTAVVVKK